MPYQYHLCSAANLNETSICESLVIFCLSAHEIVIALVYLQSSPPRQIPNWPCCART